MIKDIYLTDRGGRARLRGVGLQFKLQPLLTSHDVIKERYAGGTPEICTRAAGWCATLHFVRSVLTELNRVRIALWLMMSLMMCSIPQCTAHYSLFRIMWPGVSRPPESIISLDSVGDVRDIPLWATPPWRQSMIIIIILIINSSFKTTRNVQHTDRQSNRWHSEVTEVIRWKSYLRLSQHMSKFMWRSKTDICTAEQ